MKTSQEIIKIIKKQYSMWDKLSYPPNDPKHDPEVSACAHVLEDLLESIGELK